jgi:2-phosphoglycerate kinase
MASSLRYFVEGECEKTLLRSFMFVDGPHFSPGKIEVLNFINEKISKAKARTINKSIRVAIVFDTDVESIDTLEENLKLLKNVSQLDDENIILIPSVKTFEDEITRSCGKITNIHQFFNTENIREFKNRFINHADIVSKLISLEFDLNKIWSKNPNGAFAKYHNSSGKIKNK